VAQKLKPNRSHLKILISIGGAGKGSENFDSIASSSTLRQHFATSARTFVDQWGFDGVDSMNPLHLY
jgi:chitinase